MNKNSLNLCDKPCNLKRVMIVTTGYYCQPISSEYKIGVRKSEAFGNTYTKKLAFCVVVEKKKLSNFA